MNPEEEESADLTSGERKSAASNGVKSPGECCCQKAERSASQGSHWNLSVPRNAHLHTNM